MDEHPGMRQRAALALLPGAQQHSAHGGGHARAHGGHVRLNQLHGVVDAKTGSYLPTGSVQVHGNVGLWICRCQEQQLCLDDVGHVVIDGNPQEDDAVHHEAAEHVHLRHIELALLRNGGIDVAVIHRGVTVKGHGADAPAFYGKFLKIGHRFFASLRMTITSIHGISPGRFSWSGGLPPHGPLRWRCCPRTALPDGGTGSGPAACSGPRNG